MNILSLCTDVTNRSASNLFAQYDSRKNSGLNDHPMLKINNIYHTIDKIEEYLEKLINDFEFDILIEITRKGYWVTKLADREFDEKLSKLLKKRKIRRISDRYLMKCLNFDEFKDKIILIFDDTMNNGILLSCLLQR